ncbi:hypothetical protein [Shewanella ulleungensis]|uniref:hypothetical protein n=1 Tax=Shewanella ulleungensis TaxID=2282699 RepID=UPI003D79F0BC
MQNTVTKMITVTMISTAMFIISGCTVRLTEASFIAHDKAPVAFNTEFTQALQQAMPNNAITPLSLEASDHAKLNGFFIDNPNSNTTLGSVDLS